MSPCYFKCVILSGPDSNLRNYFQKYLRDIFVKGGVVREFINSSEMILQISEPGFMGLV